MDVGLVCDNCSALTPIGTPNCVRCGARVALDPRAPVARTRPTSIASGASELKCPTCKAGVPPGHRFCFACGERMPDLFAPEETQVRKLPPSASRTTNYFSTMQAGRARLTIIRGDGEDGTSFTLAGDEHLAGRDEECALGFPDDAFLSPVHANFFYRDRQLVVSDENSRNGVFVRIHGQTELPPNGLFVIGEQVLSARLARHIDDAPEADGTYFSASMPRPSVFEVVQHLRGGCTGRVVRVDSDAVTLGRENNGINFPEDPFISGKHAELRKQGSFFSLTDLDSRNGTFVKIDGEQVLRHGDYVYFGQQLVRVEIV